MLRADDRNACSPTPEVRTQQKRQTGVNLAILLVLGMSVTMLAMEDVLPVAIGRPSPGTFLTETAGYVLLFDAYFYVLHRLLHTRVAFRLVHAVHHRVRDVDVWSTIAMHPAEFTLLAGFLPVMMWLVPAHLISIVVVGMFLSGSITLAHSRLDFVRRTFPRLPRSGIYLTPRIHAAHHARLSCNYGATVTLFDRLFGTLRGDADPV